MKQSGRGSNHDRPDRADLIEQAALQVFYEKGYHGASIREIAKGAGIGVATLFHHFPSKAAILEHILDVAAEEMQSDLDRALAGLSDPTERLIAAVRTLALAHCERQRQSFVAQSEYRSLSPAAQKTTRRKRREIQRTVDDAVADGIAAGQFSSDHPKDVARAIVSLGTAVATWYHRGKGYTPEEVADIEVEMALSLLAARVPSR
jgi:AcrR family transcriptional regulator